MKGLFGLDDPGYERSLHKEAQRRATSGARILSLVVVAGISVAVAVVLSKMMGLGGTGLYALMAGAAFLVAYCFGRFQRNRERRELRTLLSETSSRCLDCGYDLQGLGGGNCPECGKAHEPRRADARPRQEQVPKDQGAEDLSR